MWQRVTEAETPENRLFSPWDSENIRELKYDNEGTRRRDDTPFKLSMHLYSCMRD